MIDAEFSRAVEELLLDIDYASRIAREWDGAGLDAKVAQFDLDGVALREVIRRRLETYEIPPEQHATFVRAWLEGAITGITRERRLRGT